MLIVIIIGLVLPLYAIFWLLLSVLMLTARIFTQSVMDMSLNETGPPLDS